MKQKPKKPQIFPKEPNKLLFTSHVNNSFINSLSDEEHMTLQFMFTIFTIFKYEN